MKNSIQQIIALQNELKLLPTISEDNKRKLDKKFRLEFNYNSNHIEGNTLTYSETALLLMFDKSDRAHDIREFEEMKAHDVAYKLIQQWAAENEYPLTETDICSLNEIILVRPFWKEAVTADGQNTRRLIEVGNYKKHPNSVRLQNGEMFEYASPTDTPIKMGELVQWYNAEVTKKQLTPIELAALLHYKFVCIHPFDDGNGRVSRLLMNYVLLKHNLPPIVIKSTNKKEYLNALNQADVGNIDAFINYIAQQLVASLTLVVKATKSEDIYEADDLDKEIALLSKGIVANETEKINNRAIIYTIINYCELNIWDKINTELSRFNSVFLANDNSNYVVPTQFYNGIDNYSPYDGSEVMGNRWTSTLNSLKSSKETCSFEIVMFLRFGRDKDSKEEMYSLKLKVNECEIFQSYNPIVDFNKHTTQDKITLMLKNMSAEILAQIKTHIA
ncbi:MAG: Fic family protein [Bacteroidia bacterium]|nr:Fic family protein [Bacteroidia bacterium]